jgi:hypothetical protein
VTPPTYIDNGSVCQGTVICCQGANNSHLVSDLLQEEAICGGLLTRLIYLFSDSIRVFKGYKLLSYPS